MFSQLDTKPRVILVDVDGTIADGSHRQHYITVTPERPKKHWAKFNELMMHDTPHHDIIWLVKTLRNAGNIILIVTAREGTDRIRADTQEWIDDVAGLRGYYDKIYHRAAKDYRQDPEVKIDLLNQIRADGYEPYMVLDDRSRVVAAWREAGLRCLQVQPGDF